MNTYQDPLKLGFITVEKPSAILDVQVAIFSTDGKHKLQVVRITEKKCVRLNEIWIPDIAALSVTKLKCKRKSLDCLFIFWRRPCENDGSGAVWNQIILLDVHETRSLSQLKTSLSTKCFPAKFLMRSAEDHRLVELQCSQSHVAIMPADNSDNSSSLTKSQKELKKFCTLMSNFVYSKSAGELALINRGPSTANSVTLYATPNNEKLDFVLCNGKTAEMVSRELKYGKLERPPTSPLPPPPSVIIPPHPLLPQPPPRRQIPITYKTCGIAPGINAKPFWLPLHVPPNPEDCGAPGRPDPPRRPDPPSRPDPNRVDRNNDDSLPYISDPGLNPYLEAKKQHIKAVCQRQHSQRFGEFLHAVRIDPAMVDPGPHEATTADLYRRPRLSRLAHKIPNIPVSNFSQENLENTFAECLEKISRNSFGKFASHCPIGMTPEERQRFCWRLDLVENDVLLGQGWKTFADRVMAVDNDDIEMIDVFSCQYKCQVVEVVLYHWYKLYQMASSKCKYPANKHSIILVLQNMQKFDLLHRLNWDSGGSSCSC